MEKNWVCVFHSSQSFQAEIAKEILENEEIKCVVINENDSAFPSIGEIEVMVHKDYEEKAIELLKELIN